MKNLKKIISIIGLLFAIFLLLLSSIITFVPGAEISFFILTAIICLIPILAGDGKKIRIAGILILALSLAGTYSGMERQKKYEQWLKNRVHISYSGKYQIKASVNKNKTDPTKYLCVKIHLLDSDGKELKQLQTNASDTMKWSLGWSINSEKDMIILYSSDTGTQAWEITENNLPEPIPVTDKIIQESDRIKNAKYK